MKINSNVYQEILSKLPEKPPEIGGIIGGQNGVVTKYEMDRGTDTGRGCSYAPDVEHLNSTIENWTENGIDFYGIFHTHFFGVRTLSNGDIAYMKKIIEAMPDTKKELIFPVFVLPEKEVIAYVIRKEDESIYEVPIEKV